MLKLFRNVIALQSLMAYSWLLNDSQGRTLMKQGKWLGLLMMVLFMPIAMASQTPAGNWTTMDDKTGKKRAVIKIVVSGNSLTGSVAEVFPEPGDKPLCTECPGEFKNKPIKGMQIIWGLKDKGNGEWADGQILDPKTGKIYRAKMTLEGNKLHVRGYLGVSVLGRTQVWVR